MLCRWIATDVKGWAEGLRWGGVWGGGKGVERVTGLLRGVIT